MDYLDALGPLPEVTDYSARAMWVTSLINPGPAKVAQEMRPKMLVADTAMERLHLAKIALLDSIKRLKRVEQGGKMFDD